MAIGWRIGGLLLCMYVYYKYTETCEVLRHKDMTFSDYKVMLFLGLELMAGGYFLAYAIHAHPMQNLVTQGK